MKQLQSTGRLDNKRKRPPFKIHWFLYPLACLYGAIIHLRDELYGRGLLKSNQYHLPLIGVGNITVGGTGKTPHTEYLIRLLKKDYKVAVLSRGYKRKTKGFVLATPQSSAAEIGDEPLQMHLKFPDIPIAVDKDRCHGVEQLMTLQNPPIDIIILDDAFQYRKLSGVFHILLSDFSRCMLDDKFLPAGRLRDRLKESRRANIIVASKCPAKKESFVESMKDDLHDASGITTVASSFVYADLQAAFPDEAESPVITWEEMSDKSVMLLTGIANPDSLLKQIESHAKHLIGHITCADHHNFTKADLLNLKESFAKAQKDKCIIVTTEKDRARLTDNKELDAMLKPFIYTVPIKVTFYKEDEIIFKEKLYEYIRANTRSSEVH